MIYYPVVFSRFDPSATHQRDVYSLDPREGFWREYGFGMVGIYKADFDQSGGFDMSLQGWGLEDVHLVANLVLREKVSTPCCILFLATSSDNHAYK